MLEEGLQESYERASVVVHANVALATHGETVKQLLGSGRAGASFQRFELAQGPLTYVQSRGASGVDSTLEVRVNEVRWDEVLTLFEARPKDRAYVLGTDADGKAYVEFGDGTRGSRLPTGSNNVRARYRKGLGAGGNVKAGALAQLLDRPLGVKGASNPVQAAGRRRPRAGVRGARVDPARRAHARARRLAARLRGLRARVRGGLEGARRGSPAADRPDGRRHRGPRRRSRAGGRRAARRPRRRSALARRPAGGGGRRPGARGEGAARAPGRRRPGLRERRGPGRASRPRSRPSTPARSGSSSSRSSSRRSWRPHTASPASSRSTSTRSTRRLSPAPTACSPASRPSGPAASRCRQGS